MSARVALYYAPEPEDPLSYAAASWLGRDAETNAPLPQPDIPGIFEATADPRRYGFHATLKPPFSITPGATWDGVVAATETLAASAAPFALPRLSVVDVHGYLALRETEPCPELHVLADHAVCALDQCPRAAVRGGTGPPPRGRADARTRRDAGPLGISLCPRDVVLPHDAHAAVG